MSRRRFPGYYVVRAYGPGPSPTMCTPLFVASVRRAERLARMYERANRLSTLFYAWVIPADEMAEFAGYEWRRYPDQPDPAHAAIARDRYQ